MPPPRRTDSSMTGVRFFAVPVGEVVTLRRIGNPPAAPNCGAASQAAASRLIGTLRPLCGLPVSGADPQVCAGRPRPASGTTGSASCRVRQADEGVVPRGDPRSRGTAPPLAQAPFREKRVALGYQPAAGCQPAPREKEHVHTVGALDGK